MDRRQRRTLLVVLALNVMLFAVLGVGGVLADSSALMANAVDNASDAAVYLIGFFAVGKALAWKLLAARASGVMLLIFAVGVLVDAGRRWWFEAEPYGWTMMALVLVAAVVNLVCLRHVERPELALEHLQGRVFGSAGSLTHFLHVGDMQVDQVAEGAQPRDTGGDRRLAPIDLPLRVRRPLPGVLSAQERLADVTTLAANLDAPGA